MTLTAYVEVCVSILKKAGLASRNFIYVVLTFYYILVVYLNEVNNIINIGYYWISKKDTDWKEFLRRSFFMLHGLKDCIYCNIPLTIIKTFIK